MQLNRTLKATLMIVLFSLSSCIASIEPVVQVPPIIIESSKAHFGAANSNISDVEFTDARVTDEVVSPGFVSPEGNVSSKLRESLILALTDRGVNIGSAAAKSVRGRVKTWEAHFEGNANISLRSEATLVVEVVENGFVIYTGTYNGVRSSSFPLVTSQDVQESLGLSMEHALKQLINDTKFQKALF